MCKAYLKMRFKRKDPSTEMECLITVVIVDAARYQACTEASTEKLLQGQVPVDTILVLIIVTKDIVIKVSDVGAGKIAQCIHNKTLVLQR